MSDNKKGSNDDGMWPVYLIASVAVIFLAIPVAIAAVVFLLFKSYVNRWTWAAVGFLATGFWWVERQTMWAAYSSWLRNLIHGDYSRLSIPWFTVTIWGFMWASIFGLVFSTERGRGMAGKASGIFRKMPSILEQNDSVLPSNSEFERLTSSDFSRLSTGAAAGMDDRYLVMGVAKDGSEIRIPEDTFGHMLAFGGTGSGKTVSLQVLAGGLLDLGWDGMVLDLKEDTGAGGLRDWCETYAGAHGMEYQELALSDDNPSFTFDPLMGLNADEARDTILSLQRFDDEHYKSLSIKILGQLLKLLYWAHEMAPDSFPRPTLAQVAYLCSQPDLAKAVKPILDNVAGFYKTVDGKQVFVPGGMSDAGVTRDDFDLLAAKTTDKDYQKQANSWGAKIGNLYETQAGRTILKPRSGIPELDVSRGGLAYIGLDSTSKLDLSKVISASVLQRIATDSAQRVRNMGDTKPRRKFVIVDEASVVNRQIVHALLSKVRSAGVSIILATQGPRDWIDRDGDDFSKLAQNTNLALIMNQGEPESARICAEFIGTQEVVQANLRYADGALDDTGSIRESRDYIVQPDDLRQLGTGQAILRIGRPETKVTYVKVIPRKAEGGGQMRSTQSGDHGNNPFSGSFPAVADGVPRPPRSN